MNHQLLFRRAHTRVQLLTLQLLVSAEGVIFLFYFILCCVVNVQCTGMLHGMITSEFCPKASLFRLKSFQVSFTINRSSTSCINEMRNSLNCL